MQRSTRLTTKVPQEVPGAPLPTQPANPAGLTALGFASAARQLTLAAQRRGLDCPLFRSPPELPGMLRSLRRNRDGSVTVSVVVRGRNRLAVLADMIDGVVVANNLEFGDASQVRDELWSAISSEVVSLSAPADLLGDSETTSGGDQGVARSAGGLVSMTVSPVAA